MANPLARQGMGGDTRLYGKRNRTGWVSAKGVWNPIQGLGWHMSYAEAHQFLRDSTLAISNIGREEPASGKIVLSDAEVVLGAPGDVEIRFEGGRMAAISVTFTQPPPFEGASLDLERALGRPKTSERAPHAFAESVDTWELRQKGLTLSVILKEFQGTTGVNLILTAKSGPRRCPRHAE